MTVGELRKLLGKHPDGARVVLVRGITTNDVDRVMESPSFMVQRAPSLDGAVEIHAGVRVEEVGE